MSATTSPNSHVFTFPFVTSAEVIVLGTLLPAVAIFVVALRFWIRLYRSKVGLGLDDWFILLGLILYVGMSICFIIGGAVGRMGVSEGLKPAQPVESYLISSDSLLAKLQFAFQLLLVISYGVVKLSIIALYRRLFVVERGTFFDVITKFMFVVITCWSLVFALLTIFSCGADVGAMWGSAVDQANYCSITFAANEGLAATDLVLDITLMILPQPVIWNLKMRTSKKILVSLIIMIGLSCVGTSIARVVLLAQIATASTDMVLLDQNQVITLSMYYSGLDGGLSIIAACLPTLKPLVKGWSLQGLVSGVKSTFSGSTLASDRRSKFWSPGSSNDKSSQGVRDVERSPQPLLSAPMRSPGLLYSPQWDTDEWGK